MRHFDYRFLAASSAAAALASVVGPGLPWVRAATRPHYGGTLRVEMQTSAATLDAAERLDLAEADALRKLRDLIYDRLVRLDSNGQPQPALAVAWEHDARAARWWFKLRRGVKWQDGSPLTFEEVLSALESMAPGGSVQLMGDTLEIDLGHAQPGLPFALATDPNTTIRRPAVSTTAALPIGTGPFRLTGWDPGRRAVLQANEDYWGGRPFLDAIEVLMARSSHDQLIDWESDGVDVVRLDPGEARRAQQDGRRVWTSAPIELLYLRFSLNKPAVHDRRLREAVTEAIDRAAIQKVLVQNFGETAGGMFPRWLSGYSFLFPTAMDLNRARQLVAELGTPPTLKLGYDSNDPLARQTAGRVAVNARDAGITVQVSPLPQGWRRMPDTGTELHLERARIEGPALDEAALQAASLLGFPAPGQRNDPERIYEAERKFLDNLAVVPLVYVPELVGLGSRVKDWRATPWGDWHLEGVSLPAEKP